MRKNQDTFYPDRFYHVFNRTNNKEKLFTQPKNYEYFLGKYDNYLSDVLTTYVYCLLGNHFHLLVKIHSENLLLQFENERRSSEERSSSPTDEEFDAHKIVSKQFATFFGTYSKAFNKQENRYGSLFQKPFKRVEIKNDVKFADVIYYIHANPELHKIATNFQKYKWSSFQAFISNKPTKIARAEVLDWFGGVHYFLDYHSESHDFRTNSWAIEE